MDDNKKLIQNTFKELSGKWVRFSPKLDETQCILIGVVDDVEDYYWVGITASGELMYESCVGDPWIVGDTEIKDPGYKPSEEVLKEAVKELKEEFVDIVKSEIEKLDKDKWIYFSKIGQYKKCREMYENMLNDPEKTFVAFIDEKLIKS